MAKLILVSVVLIAIAFAGIAVKLIFRKNGQFSGTCASKNPYLNDGGSCTLCGAQPGDPCAGSSTQ
ncbi:MAG: membrane or secreted protein [Flavobacteriales bacterium]|nr:membrane or secreted protein [Flavobacteriales bacterium]MCX7768168.1 membrane or secreted protein [Flavobacteriales bacterium]MDW8409120.1 membrane or secreted protein [Flavobacteriales bacterium]